VSEPSMLLAAMMASRKEQSSIMQPSGVGSSKRVTSKVAAWATCVGSTLSASPLSAWLLKATVAPGPGVSQLFGVHATRSFPLGMGLSASEHRPDRFPETRQVWPAREAAARARGTISRAHEDHHPHRLVSDSPQILGITVVRESLRADKDGCIA